MALSIHDILKAMVEKDAADVYLTVELPPMYRIQGITQPIGDKPFTNEELEALANDVMKEKQRAEFAEKMEMNLALYFPDLGRFRVNIFRQRGNVGFVIRQIKVEIVPIDKLGLPPITKDIALTKRGLVLFVGATGSGKSTSLAAMIDHRNATSPGHIITVEDPVEFVHRHKKSVITQREVGYDTHSFQAALKNTLRQAPDVILVGEIRDTETMKAAIEFAETGNLCMGTLHANNANQALERIMNFFPPRAARADLPPALDESARHHLAAVDPRRGREACGRPGNPHGHAEGQGTDQEGRNRQYQGSDGTRRPGRLPDVRLCPIQSVQGRQDLPGSGAGERGQRQQPAAEDQTGRIESGR